jgi:hypothetical protein
MSALASITRSPRTTRLLPATSSSTMSKTTRASEGSRCLPPATTPTPPNTPSRSAIRRFSAPRRSARIRFQYNRDNNQQTRPGTAPAINVIGAIMAEAAVAERCQIHTDNYELQNYTSVALGTLLEIRRAPRADARSQPVGSGLQRGFTFPSIQDYQSAATDSRRRWSDDCSGCQSVLP